MNKILKMIGAAGMMMGMLVFAGCGGGGGGDDTPPANTTIDVTASGSATATAASDVFKFASGDINYTIHGFGAGDVISLPAGGVVTVENAAFDGLVVIKWVDSALQKEVRVTLDGLTDAVDRKLIGVDAINAEFGAGTIVTR